MISVAVVLGLFLSPTFAAKNASAIGGHFLTGSAPYITMADPANDSIKALITTGDNVGKFEFSKTPDGIGAFQTGETLNVFVNHELDGTPADGFAKVSRLKLDRDGAVMNGEIVIDASKGYERFCSASLIEGSGFTHPTFLTNEEVDGGISLAVDGRTNKVTEMPWLGLIAHENTIVVPYFYNTTGKTVVLTFEDGGATDSEVYMYVANSPGDLLAGNGQLYVFSAIDGTTYHSFRDIYYSTGSVAGKFVPVSWDWKTQNGSDLNNAANAAGAFKFIRPEDGTMDVRAGHENTLYMGDTGNDKDNHGADIPVGTNGQSWERGRIYKFVFTDPADPTTASFQVVLDGKDPLAPGYNAALKLSMSNPDNLATSKNSLMIQEDRIGVTRSNPSGTYDMTNNAKILKVDLASLDANAANMEIVGYNNQYADHAAKYGDWESSGIIDVSDFFGPGTWMLDVQAHSISNGGQLLLMHVDGS